MSAYTTVQRPLPGSSDMGDLSEMKQKLVNEMGEFMKEGDRVNPTDSQLRLADELVRSNDRTRYAKIPFGDIVRRNGGDGSAEMMATAFDVLFRYTVNMLKLKRPRNWHTIKFTNAQFKARADCMIGTRNILRIMGYTKEVKGEDGIQNGLAYPDPSRVDHNIIKLIAAELLTAKTEVKNGIAGNLIMHNVFLENPFDQGSNYDRELDMYTSMQPPGAVHQPSSQGNYYSPLQPGSHHFNPSLHQHGSYQPPSQSFGQHPNTLQPVHSQPYGYQPRDQTTSHQMNYQSSGYHVSSQSSHPEKDQPLLVEDLEPTPTDTLNTSGNKLEQLRQRKANIINMLNEGDQNSGGSFQYSSLTSTSDPPLQSSATMVDSQSTIGSQSTAVSQSTARSQSTVGPGKPPPTKPRTKFLKIIDDNSKQPPSVPESIPEESTSVQKPPVQKPRRAAVRTMMECDACGFYNHEKSQICVDCDNPRTERWKKVTIPSKSSGSQVPETGQQPEEIPPVTQNNTTPLSDSTTSVPSNAQYGNRPPQNTTTTVTNNAQTAAAQHNYQSAAIVQNNEQPAPVAQHNNQPAVPVAQHSNQPSAAASTEMHGASSTDGSARIIADGFLPEPRYYTPEEKERLRRLAEQEHEKKSIQNYMAQGRYGEAHQGIGRPGGKVDYDSSMDSDSHRYKNLGSQGENLICDLKEGLRCQYMLEEIQLATEIGHGYQRHSEFLINEWNTYIERTSFRVRQLGEDFHRERKMTGTIGIPKKKEIVKALIEERGDCEKAAQKCCSNRIKMIQELMKEVQLPQSAVVLALERNGLDMDKAVRDVFRQKMNSNGLYAYIWGELEGGGIRQKQNERVKQMIKEDKYPKNYLQRLLMAEYKLPACGNCDVLIHLVRQHDLTLGACLDVAMMIDKVDAAVHLLTQECPICCEEYMRDKMINMIQCNHAMCKECFITHFTLVVGEKSIKHFNCPVCGEPDMSSETIDMGLYLQLFSGLIQANMTKDQYNLFQKKINEHAMMKDPKFLWCIECTVGFINDAGRDKVDCPNPDCKKQMCFKCKKPWEQAHDGLSCEQFAAWKKDNDPELQAQGLAAYLNEEGIECPACKFRYALAKGGCMHFKCNQCPAEFCSGCNDLFKKDCTKYESCRNKGLHAHHPRDCLFYLRDESVENLQKLLKDNDVEFDTEPPQGQVMAEAKKEIEALQEQGAGKEDQAAGPVAAEPQLKCRVMLQKENANGPPIDEECGDAVESGHAGLCLKHYKEYLVFKVNQNHIDPLPLINETGPLRAILMRDDVKVPDQQAGEGEDVYAERLRQLIKEKLPLKERKATMNF